MIKSSQGLSLTPGISMGAAMAEQSPQCNSPRGVLEGGHILLCMPRRAAVRPGLSAERRAGGGGAREHGARAGGDGARARRCGIGVFPWR